MRCSAGQGKWFFLSFRVARSLSFRVTICVVCRGDRDARDLGQLHVCVVAIGYLARRQDRVGLVGEGLVFTAKIRLKR